MAKQRTIGKGYFDIPSCKAANCVDPNPALRSRQDQRAGPARRNHRQTTGSDHGLCSGLSKTECALPRAVSCKWDRVLMRS